MTETVQVGPDTGPGQQNFDGRGQQVRRPALPLVARPRKSKGLCGPLGPAATPSGPGLTQVPWGARAAGLRAGGTGGSKGGPMEEQVRLSELGSCVKDPSHRPCCVPAATDQGRGHRQTSSLRQCLPFRSPGSSCPRPWAPPGRPRRPRCPTTPGVRGRRGDLQWVTRGHKDLAGWTPGGSLSYILLVQRWGPGCHQECGRALERSCPRGRPWSAVGLRWGWRKPGGRSLRGWAEPPWAGLSPVNLSGSSPSLGVSWAVSLTASPTLRVAI